MLIRSRKPCTRLRRLVFGWYVLFGIATFRFVGDYTVIVGGVSTLVGGSVLGISATLLSFTIGASTGFALLQYMQFAIVNIVRNLSWVMG